MKPSPALTFNIVTIEKEPHSLLKDAAKPVTFPLSEDNQALIEAMKIKLLTLGGVGLAAPQVNQAKCIIVIYIPEEASLIRDKASPYPMHALINPTYEPITSHDVSYDFEGCYSVTSKAGKVPRFNQIKLQYQDEEGQMHQQIESGFYARVLQHEIDHLNGILIIDRLTSDCIQGSTEEMMALRRKELSDEKKALYDQLMAKKLQK